jgi:chromosome segregation ATPase
MASYAQETPNQAINVAKAAIEQAVKAGASKDATDDLATANAWQAEAEKTNSLIGAVVSMAISDEAKKNRADEIVYLASMAKIKAQTAEAKAKKQAIVMATQKVQKDLDGFTGALALTKSKQDEINKLKAELDKASNSIKDLEAKLKDIPKKD